jgi:hypothetical protein
VLSGNKSQGLGGRYIIRSFTIFAAIKWAGHLARTGIIRNLHRIFVGRAKKETVSERMALFGGKHGIVWLSCFQPATELS